MNATVEQMKDAVKAAYLAQGVKAYQEVGGLWISPVQHSAPRAKAILKDAVGRLARRGLAHSLRIVRSTTGEAVHAIAI